MCPDPANQFAGSNSRCLFLPFKPFMTWGLVIWSAISLDYIFLSHQIQEERNATSPLSQETILSSPSLPWHLSYGIFFLLKWGQFHFSLFSRSPSRPHFVLKLGSLRGPVRSWGGSVADQIFCDVCLCACLNMTVFDMFILFILSIAVCCSESLLVRWWPY